VGKVEEGEKGCLVQKYSERSPKLLERSLGLSVRVRRTRGWAGKGNGKNHYGQVSRQFLTIRAGFMKRHP
jgi:hypothetical protein